MPTLRGLSPMDYALSYLTTRDRTVWEMQTYLETKEFGEADIDRTIDRLKELDLLDECRLCHLCLRVRPERTCLRGQPHGVVARPVRPFPGHDTEQVVHPEQ